MDEHQNPYAMVVGTLQVNSEELDQEDKHLEVQAEHPANTDADSLDSKQEASANFYHLKYVMKRFEVI